MINSLRITYSIYATTLTLLLIKIDFVIFKSVFIWLRALLTMYTYGVFDSADETDVGSLVESAVQLNGCGSSTHTQTFRCCECVWNGNVAVCSRIHISHMCW